MGELPKMDEEMFREDFPFYVGVIDGSCLVV
jgi:hypothetical protein